MKHLAALLAVLMVMPTAPSFAANRPVATKPSECVSASRAYSKMRYDEAVAKWEQTFKDNPTYLKDRKEQERQFWLVSRFQQNVRNCKAWFASGRTSPFTPS